MQNLCSGGSIFLGLNLSREEEDKEEEEEVSQLLSLAELRGSVIPRRGGSSGREHSLLEVAFKQPARGCFKK